MTIPDSVTSIGNEHLVVAGLFEPLSGGHYIQCEDKLDVNYFPYSVSSLTHLTLGLAITTIGDFAFKFVVISHRFHLAQDLQSTSISVLFRCKSWLVYFNKSVQSIYGLPDYIGRKYLCKNQECGCLWIW